MKSTSWSRLGILALVMVLCCSSVLNAAELTTINLTNFDRSTIPLENFLNEEEPVYRAAFLSLLMQILYPHETEGDWMSCEPFSDAVEGTFYYDYLLRARDKHLVSGIGDNLFAPLMPLTAQDMVVMTHNVLNSLEFIPLTPWGMTYTFNDADQIAPYAMPAYQALFRLGIISHDEVGFLPQNPADHQQVVEILQKIVSNLHVAPEIPETYRAATAFPLGEISPKLWTNDWEIAYGNFPHLDGNDSLKELIDAIAHYHLDPDNVLEGRMLSLTHGFPDLLGYFHSDYSSAHDLYYDFGQNILFENSPPNLLLLENITPADQDLLESGQDELVYITLGYNNEATVFVVPEEFPLDDLNREQLAALLAGEITNFNELGLESQEISFCFKKSNFPEGYSKQLEAYTGQTMTIEATYFDFYVPSGIDPDAPGYYVDLPLDYTNLTGQIGILTFSEAQEIEDAKMLSIDDIAPSEDSILKGEYPFIPQLTAVYRATDAQNAPGLMVEWLGSEAGLALLGEFGYRK